MRYGTQTQSPRLWAVVVGALVLAAVVLLAATGCRPSDTLVEVVYTQDADVVDYDAGQKNYELSPDADELHSLPDSTEDESDSSHEKTTTTVPVFGVPPTTDEAVEQVFYNENSGVSRTAPVFPDDPNDMAEDQERTQDVSNGGWDFAPDEPGEAEDEDAGAEESDTAARGVSMHTDDPKVYNASGGLLAPLENVQCIATIGEYANLALMLGGPGTVVGADDDFLESEGAQRVFGAEQWGFDDIPVLWTRNATTGAYELDFDALLEADPDLVWVPDGVELVSEEQRAELLDRGINVEPVPAMSSVRAIKEMARWLGSTLGDHTVSLVNASERAARYVDSYLGDDIDALISENGGLTTYGNVDYSGENHPIANRSNWTVLVTDWDAQARFSSGVFDAEGIAIATCGYGWSPADFYLSVGGVNNSAAQFPVPAMAGKVSGDYYVWQFNMSMLDPSLVDGVLAVSDFGETSYGWSQCLTGAPASVNRDAVFATSLGADDFRYLICTTQAATEALIAARDTDTASQSGLYAAYDYSVGEALQESGVGPRTSDGVLIRAVIGSTNGGTTSIGQDRVAAGEAPYEVATCANGLYCDWVAGSAESFLLAFWTDDLYDGDTEWSGLLDEAARFYAEFYDYTLTDDDKAQICAGRVG